MASRGLRTAILDLTQGEAGTRGTAEDRAREAAEAAPCWASPGARRSTCPTAPSKTPSKIASRSCAFCACCAPRRHPALLAGAPSRPRHRRNARLRGLLPIRPGKASRPARLLAASALQDRLRQPLRRRAPQLHRRHHALHRAAPRRADGLPIAVRQPARGSGCLSRRRDSRAHLCRGPPLRNPSAGRRDATASPSCRRKWAWSTT
jgi:hypothetical protein